jgi:hypothetical protein
MICLSPEAVTNQMYTRGTRQSELNSICLQVAGFHTHVRNNDRACGLQNLSDDATTRWRSQTR